ncbi:MAG: Ribonuclease protein component [Ferruginibacter sp.]|nr:Ribonuclease protein component [Ferruginibacter sp.]
MREAYRLQKAALADRLFTKERRLSLFIIYTGKELPEYNLVVEKISSIIGRLIKLTDEVDQNHT